MHLTLRLRVRKISLPNRSISSLGSAEVQSAHIYPKRLDGSDDARNGICLCRRHHWALDTGWISIADDHTILVRDDLPDHDDYQFIAVFAGERIRLPLHEEAAPHPIFLQQHRKLSKVELQRNEELGKVE